MAVQAAFSADVVVGATPLTINFTGESTGAPTAWLWDFGDGYTSDAQHPTHIYETDGAYTVTLRAFITTGTSTVADIITSQRRKDSAPSSSNQATEHTELLADSWETFDDPGTRSAYKLEKSGGKFTYSAVECTLSFDLTSVSSKIAIFQMKFNNTIDNPEESVSLSIGGTFDSPSDRTNFLSVKDVTSYLGTTPVITLSDLNSLANLMTPPADGNKTGWVIQDTQILLHTYSDQDTETKENYIVAGPPIAAFSGVPLSGANPLSVVFSDESLGHVTGRSWRKRKAGTNDAFVEFSTAANPTHNFDKANP